MKTKTDKAASSDWEAAMHREGRGLILMAATTLTGTSTIATGFLSRRHAPRTGRGD
jgi:hypothetical protein